MTAIVTNRAAGYKRLAVEKHQQSNRIYFRELLFENEGRICLISFNMPPTSSQRLIP